MQRTPRAPCSKRVSKHSVVKHVVRGQAVGGLVASFAARKQQLNERKAADMARIESRHASDLSTLHTEANNLGAALPTMSPVKMKAATSAVKAKKRCALVA